MGRVALFLSRTVVLLMLRNWIRQAFRGTAMRAWLACQLGLKVAFELRIEHYYLRDGFLVPVELILQKLTVLSINAGLKLVSLYASIEAELQVAEQIRHLADIGPILHINEVMFALLHADWTELICSVTFGEALLAEDAVAVQDEAACAFEAEVALVAMHLELLVHITILIMHRAVISHNSTSTYLIQSDLLCSYLHSSLWFFPCLVTSLQMMLASLFQAYNRLLMADQFQKILLPKIKKMDFRCKVILDPSDFRRGLPKTKLPELNEKGLILALQNKKSGVSHMTGQGSLKLNVQYCAQVLCVVGRYVEVRVVDEIDEETWIGLLLGVTVKGRGGEGAVRGCRIIRVQGNSLVAEGVSTAGNQLWQKLLKKVERILEEQE